MDTVKLGIVGLGRGYGAASQVIGEKSVRISAICDIDENKRQEVLSDLKSKGVENVKSFSDFDEMLKSDIDAVFIATYATKHVEFVEKAMNEGKHVISEIPAVNSVDEAKRLRACVKAHPNLKYMCGENCCFWAFIQSWKKMFEDGKIGDAVYAESEYLHGEDFREFKKENFPKEHWRSFNPAIKYITHNLGPLLYILNDSVVSVSCMEPDVRYNPYKYGPETGVAIFKTKKGAVIRILICFGAYVGIDHNFTILGTRGTLETDKVKPLNEAHTFARLSEVPCSMTKKIEIPVALSFDEAEAGGHGGADKKMLMAFVKCILEDTQVPIDVDMGIAMAIPGIIAHQSAEQGGAVLEIPQI